MYVNQHQKSRWKCVKRQKYFVFSTIELFFRVVQQPRQEWKKRDASAVWVRDSDLKCFLHGIKKIQKTCMQQMHRTGWSAIHGWTEIDSPLEHIQQQERRGIHFTGFVRCHRDTRKNGFNLRFPECQGFPGRAIWGPKKESHSTSHDRPAWRVRGWVIWGTKKVPPSTSHNRPAWRVRGWAIWGTKKVPPSTSHNRPTRRVRGWAIWGKGSSPDLGCHQIGKNANSIYI